MAANKNFHQLGSPQEHIEMCDQHDFFLDMLCEECDLFICSTCAKMDHKNHNWVTQATAASQRRRGLLKYLGKIKEEDMSGIDDEIDKTLEQIKENEKQCDLQVQKLQKHYKDIITRLTELRKLQEKTLKDNLIQKNEQMNRLKSQLETKKKQVTELVEFLEENNSTMSDYSLIDNHRELKRKMSDADVDMNNYKLSARYSIGEVSEGLLESLIGYTFDLNDISATETNSFMYKGEGIQIMRAFSEESCHITNSETGCLEEVNRQGEKKRRFSIAPSDFCVTANGDVYFTEDENQSINLLSPSGSVSTVAKTLSFYPESICETVEGNLLVTLQHREGERHMGLIRHMTLTGQIIRDYEYMEDGKSRVFAYLHDPVNVTQSRNTDIGFIDCFNESQSNLVVMSLSGHIRFIHEGGYPENDSALHPVDLVFDSCCNIIVSDVNSDCILLLSPDGEFLKILLTARESNSSLILSLCGSSLWVGNSEGLVKVFKYKNSQYLSLNTHQLSRDMLHEEG